MMTTLVLIGGKSARFLEAGYKVPKPLLPGRTAPTILQEVVTGLNPECLVMSGWDRDQAELEATIDFLSPSFFRAKVWSRWPPMGPVFGLLEASGALQVIGDGPLVISYCDVILPNGIEKLLDLWRGYETGGVIFKSSDPRYGYWLSGRVYEKQVVSPWAVSGVFYFKSSFEALRRAELRRTHFGDGIPHLLDSNTMMVEAEVIDVGTPADYEAYLGLKVLA